MIKQQSNITGRKVLIVTFTQLTCPHKTLLDIRSKVVGDCQKLKKNNLKQFYWASKKCKTHFCGSQN